MGRDDVADFLGLAAGAILGYAFLKLVFGEKIPCPNCRRPILKEVKQCPHCRVWLGW